MKPLHTLLFTALVAGFLAGCNSTSVEQSWKAPEASTLTFKKILVVAPSGDGATRRNAEDTLKAQLTGVEVVQSYTLLAGKEDLADKAKAGKVIKDNGIDGVVIMRMVSNETELNYMPGSPPMAYGSMWGYWGRNYALAPYYYGDTGTVTSDKVIGIETNIYDVATEKLLWSGQTKTVNPNNVQSLIADTVGAIRTELQKQKLIP